MAEVAAAGEEHAHGVLVGRGGYLFVTYRAPGLDHRITATAPAATAASGPCFKRFADKVQVEPQAPLWIPAQSGGPRRTFPVGVLGSSSTTSMRRGHL